MWDILIYFVLFLFAVYFVKEYRRNPPGPYGLPFLGYYPFLGKDPIKILHQLSQKHGEIMSINLLGETYWVLNSYEAIKEAFITKGDIFAARPVNEYGLFQLLSKNTVVEAEGDEWRAETKFTLSHLAQLGMGKSEFEITIHSILDDVDKYIESKQDLAHDYLNTLHNLSISVMTEMVCRQRYGVDSPTFLLIENWTNRIFSTLGYMNMTVSGEIFRLLMKCKPHYQKTLQEAEAEFCNFTRQLINERMKTFDANHCSDLLDYLLKESLGKNGEYFNIDKLPKKVMGLFMASDTPASILYYALYFMAAKSKIQQKVFDEIDNTIGTDREFGYLEKDRLPYTQAVIAEIMRFISLAPLGNVHVNRIPTQLMGYKVPIRQKVIANIYALSRNPKYFLNPYEFDPNNFLDDKDHFKPNPASIPFGVGVRKCLGMKLAEFVIFIAFVRLIRKFYWKLDGHITPSVLLGNFQLLQSYKLIAKRRI